MTLDVTNCNECTWLWQLIYDTLIPTSRKGDREGNLSMCLLGVVFHCIVTSTNLLSIRLYLKSIQHQHKVCRVETIHVKISCICIIWYQMRKLSFVYLGQFASDSFLGNLAYLPGIIVHVRDIKLGNRIGSDWSQRGKIWDFLRSVSVHFGSPRQNVMKLILKSPRFVPSGANLT